MTVTDDDVNDFLEHVGVRGMHWGHRKAQIQTTPQTTYQTTRSTQPKKPRTKKQKVALVGAGVAGGILGMMVAGRGSMGSLPITVLGTGAGGAGGYALAKHVIDKNSKIKVSELSTN